MSARSPASACFDKTDVSINIIAAVRYLLAEAKRTNLTDAAAVLSRTEAALSQPANRTFGAWSAASADEGALLRDIAVHLGGNPAERRFKLQALAELSSTLATSDLVQLAYLAESSAAHLHGFLALFETADVRLPAA